MDAVEKYIPVGDKLTQEEVNKMIEFMRISGMTEETIETLSQYDNGLFKLNPLCEKEKSDENVR